MMRWCWKILPVFVVTWIARRWGGRQTIGGDVCVQVFDDVLVLVYPPARIKDMRRLVRHLERRELDVQMDLERARAALTNVTGIDQKDPCANTKTG